MGVDMGRLCSSQGDGPSLLPRLYGDGDAADELNGEHEDELNGEHASWELHTLTGPCAKGPAVGDLG